MGSQADESQKIESSNSSVQQANPSTFISDDVKAATARNLDLTLGKSRDQLLAALVQSLVRKNKELQKQNLLLLDTLNNRRSQVEYMQIMNYKSRIRANESERLQKPKVDQSKPKKSHSSTTRKKKKKT